MRTWSEIVSVISFIRPVGHQFSELLRELTGPPKVIWEERVATPTSENALSHCVC